MELLHYYTICLGNIHTNIKFDKGNLPTPPFNVAAAVGAAAVGAAAIGSAAVGTATVGAAAVSAASVAVAAVLYCIFPSFRGLQIIVILSWPPGRK